MPLTLDQYADYLDTRGVPRPQPPAADPVRAKPHLPTLPGIRAVLWTGYGTLLRIFQGELLFEHPHEFVMDAALQKTIDEFNMWNSMSRKPGQPSAYMKEIYTKTLTEMRMLGSGGEKYPEVASERIWESIIKKLLAKDFKFDAGFFGSLNEFSRKVAYFFHAGLQGTACYDGAGEAIRAVAAAGVVQGLCADGQSFTPTQLYKGLKEQLGTVNLADFFPEPLRILSGEKRAKKPSETLFRTALQVLAKDGIEPSEVLHVGSSLVRDIAPARKLGMRTALFTGDRNSLAAPADKLKEPAFRPDALLTELPQVAQLLG